jgi:hypothetical protein
VNTATILGAKIPSEQDKRDVLDAAEVLSRAEAAAAKSPNDPEKAAAAIRAHVAVTETALRIGRKLAETPEEMKQLAGLEKDFYKAKAELAGVHAELTELARAKESFVELMTKKYAGVPVYGWAGIAVGTGLVLRSFMKKSSR